MSFSCSVTATCAQHIRSLHDSSPQTSWQAVGTRGVGAAPGFCFFFGRSTVAVEETDEVIIEAVSEPPATCGGRGGSKREESSGWKVTEWTP